VSAIIRETTVYNYVILRGKWFINFIAEDYCLSKKIQNFIVFLNDTPDDITRTSKGPKKVTQKRH